MTLASKKISPLLIESLSAASMSDVSDSAISEPALSDLEHEIHIEDCHHQYRVAYERFELHGSPHDRDEALLHLHRMNQALVNRPGQYERHAAFERRLDEGVDYFANRGAADRVEMERRAA